MMKNYILLAAVLVTGMALGACEKKEQPPASSAAPAAPMVSEAPSGGTDQQPAGETKPADQADSTASAASAEPEKK